MSNWTYNCETCAQSFTLERPRKLRKTKAPCRCGGDAFFVKPPVTPAPAPVETRGPAGISIDTCTNVSITGPKIDGFETGFDINDSDVTIRGAVLRTNVGIETRGKSTLDVADIVHRVPRTS